MPSVDVPLDDGSVLPVNYPDESHKDAAIAWAKRTHGGGVMQNVNPPAAPPGTSVNTLSDVGRSALAGATGAPLDMLHQLAMTPERLKYLAQELLQGQGSGSSTMQDLNARERGYYNDLPGVTKYTPQTMPGDLTKSGVGGAVGATMMLQNPLVGVASGLLGNAADRAVPSSPIPGMAASASPYLALALAQGLRGGMSGYGNVRQALEKLTPEERANIERVVNARLPGTNVMAGQVASGVEPQSSLGSLWRKGATVPGDNPVQEALATQNPAQGVHPVADQLDTAAQLGRPWTPTGSATPVQPADAEALAAALRTTSGMRGKNVSFTPGKTATQELSAAAGLSPEGFKPMLGHVPAIRGVAEHLAGHDVADMMSEPTLEAIKEASTTYQPMMVPDLLASRGPYISALRNALSAYLVPAASGHGLGQNMGTGQ